MTTRRSSIAAAAAAVLVGFLLAPPQARACSCGPRIANPAVALRSVFSGADLVFRGTVLSVTPTTLPALPDGANANDVGHLPGTTGYVAVLRVDRLWKDGAAQLEVPVFTGATMCDVPLDVGAEALLFAYGPDPYGFYTATECAQALLPYASAAATGGALDALTTDEIQSWQDDFVSYGCGGGIAAKYQRSYVYRDGRRRHESRSALEPDAATSTELAPDAEFATRVFSSLDYNELETLDGLKEPAPWSCSYHVRVFGIDYTATWGASQRQPSERLLRTLRSVSGGSE